MWLIYFYLGGFFDMFGCILELVLGRIVVFVSVWYDWWFFINVLLKVFKLFIVGSNKYM